MSDIKFLKSNEFMAIEMMSHDDQSENGVVVVVKHTQKHKPNPKAKLKMFFFFFFLIANYIHVVTFVAYVSF